MRKVCISPLTLKELEKKTARYTTYARLLDQLASSVERKRYMKQMLALRSPSLGIGHHKRIEAVTPESPAYNVTRLKSPVSATPNDLAIIMSHLAAMRTAVYDQHQSWERANMR